MYENTITLYGHITHTPELEKSENGVSYLSFSIASNKIWFEDGKSKTRGDFISCVGFGKNAETITKNFAKGSAIYLRGELMQSTWETKDGKKRNDLKVLVNSFEFVDKKPVSKEEQTIIIVDEK